MEPEKLQSKVDILEEHITLLEAMHEILEREHHALRNNRFDDFGCLLEEKQQLLNAIETINDRFLNAFGVDHEGAGNTGYPGMLDADRFSTHVILNQKWKKFLGLLHKCDNQNKTNNRIMESSRVMAKQALNILRAGGNDVSTYNPSGKQSISGSEKPLASA